MVNRRLNAFAAAAALAMSIATKATAGGCCPAAVVDCGCAGPALAPGAYLVNQGPVFSGPGHYLRSTPDVPPPADYPYVGFVYSGYPWGVWDSGGYARGFYDPMAGYPYADPPPRIHYMHHSTAAYRGPWRSAYRHHHLYPRH